MTSASSADILSVQIIGAADLKSKDEKNRNSNYFCVLSFYGSEIGRTPLAESTDPVWHHIVQRPMSTFAQKVREFNRPASLEHIELEIWEQWRNFGSPEICSFGRIPLSIIAKGPQTLRCFFSVRYSNFIFYSNNTYLHNL